MLGFPRDVRRYDAEAACPGDRRGWLGRPPDLALLEDGESSEQPPHTSGASDAEALDALVDRLPLSNELALRGRRPDLGLP